MLPLGQGAVERPAGPQDSQEQGPHPAAAGAGGFLLQEQGGFLSSQTTPCSSFKLTKRALMQPTPCPCQDKGHKQRCYDLPPLWPEDRQGNRPCGMAPCQPHPTSTSNVRRASHRYTAGNLSSDPTYQHPLVPRPSRGNAATQAAACRCPSPLTAQSLEGGRFPQPIPVLTTTITLTGLSASGGQQSKSSHLLQQ